MCGFSFMLCIWLSYVLCVCCSHTAVREALTLLCLVRQRAEEDVLTRLQETARLEDAIRNQIAADDSSEALDLQLLAEAKHKAVAAIYDSRVQRQAQHDLSELTAAAAAVVESKLGAGMQAAGEQSFAEAIARVQQRTEQEAAKQASEKQALAAMTEWRKESKNDIPWFYSPEKKKAVNSASVTDLLGKLERMRHAGSPVASNILGDFGLPVPGPSLHGLPAMSPPPGMTPPVGFGRSPPRVHLSPTPLPLSPTMLTLILTLVRALILALILLPLPLPRTLATGVSTNSLSPLVACQHACVI